MAQEDCGGGLREPDWRLSLQLEFELFAVPASALCAAQHPIGRCVGGERPQADTNPVLVGGSSFNTAAEEGPARMRRVEIKLEFRDFGSVVEPVADIPLDPGSSAPTICDELRPQRTPSWIG